MKLNILHFILKIKLNEINLNKLFCRKKTKKYILGIILFLIIIGILLFIRRKIKLREYKKDLLLEIKSKGKNKIKKMNNEEKGYELK